MENNNQDTDLEVVIFPDHTIGIIQVNNNDTLADARKKIDTELIEELRANLYAEYKFCTNGGIPIASLQENFPAGKYRKIFLIKPRDSINKIVKEEQTEQKQYEEKSKNGVTQRRDQEKEDEEHANVLAAQPLLEMGFELELALLSLRETGYSGPDAAANWLVKNGSTWNTLEEKKVEISNNNNEETNLECEDEDLSAEKISMVKKSMGIWGKTFLQILLSSQEILSELEKKPEKIDKNVDSVIKHLKKCITMLDTLALIPTFAGPAQGLKIALTPIVNNRNVVAGSLKVAIKSLKHFVTLFVKIYEKLPKKEQEEVESKLGTKKFILLAALFSTVLGFSALGIATISLPLLGFTTTGITAGTFGAWLMSTYGGYVGATTLVAILQSAGVVGFGLAGGAFIVGVVAIISFGAIVIKKL